MNTHKTILKIAFLSCLLGFSSSALSKVYKWTDEKGEIHYSATPPPQNIDSEEVEIQKQKTSAAPAAAAPAPEKDSVDGTIEEQCSKAIKKYPEIISQLGKTAEELKSAGKRLRADTTKSKKLLDANIANCIKNYNPDKISERDGIKQLVDYIAKNDIKASTEFVLNNEDNFMFGTTK